MNLLLDREPLFCPVNVHVLPKSWREKQGCALYVSIMIACHGCNNPRYNVHKNVGAHYTREHVIHGKIR